MSLLNDMLKDLDEVKQRSGKTQVNHGEKRTLEKSRKTGWVFPAVALLALGYFLIVEWNVLGVMPEPAKDVSPDTSKAANEWSTRLNARLAEEKAKQARESKQSVSAVLDTNEETLTETTAELDAQNSYVNDLQSYLKRASTLMSEGSFELENARRAFGLFRSALALDANNTLALQGVENIKNAVIDRLHVLEREKNTSALEETLNLARAVNVSKDNLDMFTASVNTLKAPTSTQPAPASQLIRASKEIKDQELAAKISRFGPEDYQAQVFDRLKDGKPTANSVIVLAKQYFANENVNKLKALERVLSSNLPLQKFVKAHRYGIEQGVERSVVLLEAINLPFELEHERVRQLAGFYQALKQHKNANFLYRQLTASHFSTVDDWLGLAVTYEAQGQSRYALIAYQKVRKIGHYDENISRYVQSRLRAL